MISSAALGFKYSDSKDPRLVITAKEVVARYGPSNRETQAFTLHLGAEGHQKDETGDWIFIELPNRGTGWIPKSACEKI